MCAYARPIHGKIPGAEAAAHEAAVVLDGALLRALGFCPAFSSKSRGFLACKAPAERRQSRQNGSGLRRSYRWIPPIVGDGRRRG